MKSILFFISLLFIFNIATAQSVGVGTSTPNQSAILDINSNAKGVAMPTLTDSARNAIVNPVEGLLIFNSTTKNLNLYKNGNWNEITSICVPQPTTSSAGAAQNPPGTSTTLAANTAISGSGLWSILAGIGGVIAFPTNPTSTFSGLAGGSYLLRWTITTSCGASSSNVTITFQATCNDGIKNGTETDIDCGGGTCPKCANGKLCAAGTDCISGVCMSGTCQIPACTDGVKNGTETDIDCGGACPKCANGKNCLTGNDCISAVCMTSTCQVPACNDGVKNGTETDIDCGGATCPKCANGKICLAGSDCGSGVCTGGICQIPACTDGVKNGTETDIDCGGTCPKCATGKTCIQNTDCVSNICSSGHCL